MQNQLSESEVVWKVRSRLRVVCKFSHVFESKFSCELVVVGGRDLSEMHFLGESPGNIKGWLGRFPLDMR